MYHFDQALLSFLEKILYENKELIVLRDLQGRLSCHIRQDDTELQTELEDRISSDQNLQYYCSDPCVITHDTDDPLWNRMREIAQPIPQYADKFPLIKIIERIFEGRAWLDAIPSPITSPPYIISFYSFKGGVGRTTAAAMTALKLARQGKRICLIDFDLEAPGLSGFASENIRFGLIDYLLERPLSQDMPLNMEDYLISVSDQGVNDKGGELWLFPAGNLDDGVHEYLVKLGRIDFQAMLSQNNNSPLSYLFKDLQKYKNFDYFIADSRTGITDIGGLALNSLSHLNVLIFGLGKQNIQGMSFVLQHLSVLLQKQKLTPEQISGRLLLAFSPVPLGSDKEENDKIEDNLRDESYEVFKKYIYEPFWRKDTSFPSVNDDDSAYDPVPHDPVLIQYIRELPFKNELAGMDYAQSRLADPPYDRLTERIENKLSVLKGDPEISDKTSAISSDNLTEIRDGLSKLSPTGQAETDLDDEEKLRTRFLPLPQFRFLFEPKAFLILGRKGSGKSALFQVLKFQNYINDLAAYYKLNQHSLSQAKWIVGFGQETHQFLSSTFISDLGKRAEQEKYPTLYTKFWKYLAVREIQKALEHDNSRFILSMNDHDIFANQLFDAQIGSEVDNFLKKLEKQQLYPGVEQIYLTYDYLDKMVSFGDVEIRSRYISGLIDWWQSSIRTNRYLFAKIFLREDIFEREVRIEDKAKIRENVFLYKIRWDENKIYRLFLKIAFPVLDIYLQKHIPEINQKFKKEKVGIIPPEDDRDIRKIIEYLIGEYMGKEAKRGYTFTWIPKHLFDSQKHVAPRWIIALFSVAARIAMEEKRLISPLIPQDMIRKALQSEVSEIAVADLKQEYSEELETDSKDFLPDTFKESFKTFPQSRDDLLKFIRKKIKAKNPENILERMTEIGLLGRRGPTQKYSERYQIPDIFLYGLGLSRRG